MQSLGKKKKKEKNKFVESTRQLQLIGPHFLAFPFSPARRINNACRSQECFESRGGSWVALDGETERCQTEGTENTMRENEEEHEREWSLPKCQKIQIKKKKKQFRTIKEIRKTE